MLLPEPTSKFPPFSLGAVSNKLFNIALLFLHFCCIVELRKVIDFEIAPSWQLRLI